MNVTFFDWGASVNQFDAYVSFYTTFAALDDMNALATAAILAYAAQLETPLTIDSGNIIMPVLQRR